VTDFTGFELKYFRKLYIQEWERQEEKKRMNNEKVFIAVRKLTGHRPLSDVHRVNYAKISTSELWKYYKEIYYDLSVLTEEQKMLVGLVERKAVLKPAMVSRQVSMVDRDTKTAILLQETTAMKTQLVIPATGYVGILN